MWWEEFYLYQDLISSNHLVHWSHYQSLHTITEPLHLFLIIKINCWNKTGFTYQFPLVKSFSNTKLLRYKLKHDSIFFFWIKIKKVQSNLVFSLFEFPPKDPGTLIQATFWEPPIHKLKWSYTKTRHITKTMKKIYSFRVLELES